MDARWMKVTPFDPIIEVTEAEVDARRAMRRGLRLKCELATTYWERPVRHEVSDLSPYGAWIDTSFPLHLGAEVEISMRPPGWDCEDLVVSAKVTRVVTELSSECEPDSEIYGMGLEFIGLGQDEQERLCTALVGIPPRLKSSRRASLYAA